jgi:hypothetical protein
VPHLPNGHAGALDLQRDGLLLNRRKALQSVVHELHVDAITALLRIHYRSRPRRCRGGCTRGPAAPAGGTTRLFAVGTAVHTVLYCIYSSILHVQYFVLSTAV